MDGVGDMAVPDLFLVRHGPGRVPVLGLPRKRREPSLCPLLVNRLEGGDLEREPRSDMSLGGLVCVWAGRAGRNLLSLRRFAPPHGVSEIPSNYLSKSQKQRNVERKFM